MNLTNFTFSDGLMLSAFAMLVVFLILLILQFIIYGFKFLPRELQVKPVGEKVVRTAGVSDEEEEMVAMLMAAILAKEEYKGDVRVKSIRRIR